MAWHNSITVAMDRLSELSIKQETKVLGLNFLTSNQNGQTEATSLAHHKLISEGKRILLDFFRLLFYS
jgi:hypothetical protein